MKPLLILIISLLIACNNMPEQGFTNKAEAKNLMVNGLKEGKWVEYTDDVGIVITDMQDTDREWSFYKLTIYKAGKPYGIVRQYYRNGKLEGECPYVQGKRNGVEIWYYQSTKLRQKETWKNDTLNGEFKDYYESGKLRMEGTGSGSRIKGCILYYENGQVEREPPPGGTGIEKKYYEDGKLKQEISILHGETLNGPWKDYYENGKLKREIIYSYDSVMSTKNFDENGNEIK
jgi:antitoxin component YwqK of YwqJK toxin-antitoxin module